MGTQALWQKYQAWFGALAPREKLIVAIAVVGGIVFLGYSYAIEPALLRAQAAKRTLLTLPAETMVLQAQTTQLTAQAQDPDAPLRAEMARVDADYAEQSQRFRIVERSLLPPAEMAQLLDQLLKRSRGLELLSLRSLPAVPVLADAARPDEKKPATTTVSTPPETEMVSGQLYRHGIELRIAGNYLDLLHYLEQLEREAPNLLWGRLDLKTETYPRSVMTLTLHTLSMDLPWLSL